VQPQQAAQVVVHEQEVLAPVWQLVGADEDALLRALLSLGPVTAAIRHSGEPAVADAIRGALEPQRRPDGGYRLENEWHFLLTRA
jgi:hypothetical protein